MYLVFNIILNIKIAVGLFSQDVTDRIDEINYTIMLCYDTVWLRLVDIIIRR